MTSLKAYLNSPKARKALSTKPGEEGFSLIELVVVVAVLAALSAIAIPSFTNISMKAKATAAANTVANVAKSCAVKFAADDPSKTFPAVTLDGYASFSIVQGTGASATSSTTNCSTAGVITAKADDEDDLPTFKYDIQSGAKTCDANSGKPAETGRGCTSGKW